MKILINFSLLKSGGGQNVAMNFLNGLDPTKFNENSFIFVAAESSPLEKALKNLKIFKYIKAPRNPIKRIFFELTFLSVFIWREKIDILYTYFGYSLIISKIKQISGSADSNIYYPDINFWADYNWIGRLKKKLIDCYRVWGVKKADALIFENQALLNKAISIYKKKNVKLILPSISPSKNAIQFFIPDGVKKNSLKVLFLCGWQLNKNVMLIPEIAAEAKKNRCNFHFLLTANADGSRMHKSFVAKLEESRTSNLVYLIGEIPKAQLVSLYQNIDIIVLLSKLESFSNNIIEAWYFKKPLLIASEEWSRKICKDAALYVSRDSPNQIVKALKALATNPALKTSLIKNGKKELSCYPKIHERIKAEIDYVEYIFKND